MAHYCNEKEFKTLFIKLRDTGVLDPKFIDQVNKIVYGVYKSLIWYNKRSSHEFNDLVQDVLLIILQQIDKTDTSGNLFNYVTTLTHNHYFQAYNRRRRYSKILNEIFTVSCIK